MFTTADVSRTYRIANAENVKIIEWLIATGVCASKIDGANYLNGRAGGYVRDCYRASVGA